jgi:hypothetical protein
MKIFWFDDASPGDRTQRTAIEEWVSEHREEIHAIHHFVSENEIEALRIISGEQVKDAAGWISIKTIELHFYCNLLLIVRTEERQDPDRFLGKTSA